MIWLIFLPKNVSTSWLLRPEVAHGKSRPAYSMYFYNIYIMVIKSFKPSFDTIALFCCSRASGGRVSKKEE